MQCFKKSAAEALPWLGETAAKAVRVCVSTAVSMYRLAPSMKCTIVSIRSTRACCRRRFFLSFLGFLSIMRPVVPERDTCTVLESFSAFFKSASIRPTVETLPARTAVRFVPLWHLLLHTFQSPSHFLQANSRAFLHLPS